MDWYLLLNLFALISIGQGRGILHDGWNTATSLLSSFNVQCFIPGLCSQNSQNVEPMTFPMSEEQNPQYSQVPQYNIDQYPQNPVEVPNSLPAQENRFSQELQVPEQTNNQPDLQMLEANVPQTNQELPVVDNRNNVEDQPAEKQRRITCPRNGQHYPIYDDCKKYFICVNGFLEEISCPNGLYYNCMTQTCETDTLKLCCKNDKNTPRSVFKIPNRRKYPCREGAVNGYDPKNIIKCLDDKIYSASCDSNNEFCMDSLQCFDPTTKSCDENALGTPYQPEEYVAGIEIDLEPNEICPSGKQNFEIKDNCGAYYNCSSGDPYLYMCPEGYFYDCWNQICSKTTSVYCCYQDERYTFANGETDLLGWDNREYQCHEGMKMAFERTNFKEYYAICSGNLLYYGSCFPNHFCNLTNSCYDPNSERCVSPLASKFSATTEIGIHQKPHSHKKPPKLNSPRTTTTTTEAPPVEEDSTEYIDTDAPETVTSETTVDANAEPMEQKVSPPVAPQAPAGTAHISAIASDQCFDRFSTLAVYKDCSRFIIYNNSVATTYSCPETLKFDGFKKCCVKEHTSFTGACEGDPNKSFVNDQKCSEMEVENEEHPTKCDSYFNCNSFGLIVEQICPSGEVFDWQKKGCVDEGSATTVPNCSSH